jgi:hypothetical protein
MIRAGNCIRRAGRKHEQADHPEDTKQFLHTSTIQ